MRPVCGVPARATPVVTIKRTPCSSVATTAGELLIVAALALGIAALLPSAEGVSATWNGTTDSNWSTPTNWSATPVPGTGNTATFANAGNGHTTLSIASVFITNVLFDTANAAAYTIGAGGVNVQTLLLDPGAAITVNSTVTNNQTFNAGLILGPNAAASNYTFTNSSLTATLTFAGSINGGNGPAKTIVVTGAGNGAISGAISNGGAAAVAVSKTGSGTWVLSGANTFTGALTVSSGTLSIPTINDASANGPLGNSATSVTLGSAGGISGTLEYTGATASSSKRFTLAAGGTGVFQIDTAATSLTLSGAIDGAGALTKTGPGTLFLSPNFNNSSYSGGTTISGGTLAPVLNTALGSGGLTMNGGTLSSTLSGGQVVVNDAVINPVAGNTFDSSTGSILVLNLTGSGTVTKIGNRELFLGTTNIFTGKLITSVGTTTIGGGSASATWGVAAGAFFGQQRVWFVLYLIAGSLVGSRCGREQRKSGRWWRRELFHRWERCEHDL